MKKIITLIIVFLYQTVIFAQQKNKFSFEGYTEAYYSYDFNEPANHLKPNFLYNHKRHNEINLNLAYAKGSYKNDDFRSNIAIMVGNYAQYNLANEPNWAQFIYEANIGLKLSKKENIWVDLGIFPSHIGFESAVSADCWTLTRSILAENSPYYEAGARISYTSKSEKFNAAFLVLNGWQHIQRPDSIQKPSFGFQLNYRPTPKLVLNYSNFIGTDKPESYKAWRTFHNFYAVYEPNPKFGVTAGFDIGTDKYNTSDYSYWYSPVCILRYRPKEKYTFAFRTEYYNDQKQIMISTNTPNGFQTIGTSLNFDVNLKSNMLWRIEAKNYHSKDDIFDNKNNNFSITTSLSVKF